MFKIIFYFTFVLLFSIEVQCEKDSSSAHSPRAQHVVHIGVDGLRADCIELAPGGAPNILTRLASQGTWTLTLGRTVNRAVSAPGWSSTLTSMSPELTGIKSNFWTPPWLDPANTSYPVSHLTPVTGNRTPPPTVFKVIKEQESDIQTAAFYSWEFFEYWGNQAHPATLDKDVSCYGDTLDEIEFCDESNTNELIEHLSSAMQNNTRTYSFIYFLNVDSTGHQYGWCGTQYSDAIATMDSQVGDILDMIDNSEYANSTLVILSTDHGGKGRYHGRGQDTDLIVPIFMKGAGVKQNSEFNAAVTVMDIVPTAVYTLGLEPSLWWQGKARLDAFDP